MDEIQSAINTLERIANVEKEEWLPSYYSTIGYITMASKDMQAGGGKVQDYVEQAKKTLEKAQELAGDNSEVITAQGYLYLAHIWINPMANGAKYSPMAYTAFDQAMEADPSNPRPLYLKAQNIFFTPEAFGGGKSNAEPLFKMAKEKFESFEAASEIHPDWGKEANDYFLSLCRDKGDPAGEEKEKEE